MKAIMLKLAAEVVAMVVDMAASQGETITPEEVIAASRSAIATNRTRLKAARDANTTALEDGE